MRIRNPDLNKAADGYKTQLPAILHLSIVWFGCKLIQDPITGTGTPSLEYSMVANGLKTQLPVPTPSTEYSMVANRLKTQVH